MGQFRRLWRRRRPDCEMVCLREPQTFRPAYNPRPVLTRALAKQVQEDREVQRDLATEFGLANGEPGRLMRVGPEYVHVAFNRSLSRLGVEHVFLYHSHRVDPTFPIEYAVSEMAE
jgi:aryl-alcohol dehydrogenase-like predicted oxidoreductase